MTTALKTCPKCGAELAVDAPEGLCLQCLLAQRPGNSDVDATIKGATPVRPPSSQPPAPLIPLPMPTMTGYQILREISRGGQAVVFEGIQQSTTKKVAVKVIQGGAFIGPKERARFEREVLVLAALNHPNIVPVVDRGTTVDGSSFLVMPYLSGRPLDKWLLAYYQQNPGGPPPDDPSELLQLFLRICDAVNAAHLRGVVHRDLKPSNIFIDDNNEPHILDFGLARTAFDGMTDEETPQPVTITGQFLGSLPWASPEQAEGAISKIDTRTDVYALGVILYQMLTGKFPYEVVGNMADVLKNIQTAKPNPPSAVQTANEAKQTKHRQRWLLKHRRAINGTMDEIILKALAKRREDRYQSAGELARDLANYLSGRPTVAAGGPPESRWSVRRVTAGIAVAVVCLVVAAIWAVNRPSSPVEPGATRATPLAQVKSSGESKELILDLGDEVKMEFVLVPAGSFMMGSENGEQDEQPVHKVTITKPFYLGRYEITQRQWQAVMGSTPSHFKGANHPVDGVSWNDCQDFVAKLKEKLPGHDFGLPTEAQWEYACRAGTTTGFSFGDDSRAGEYAWSAANSGSTTHPVGQKKPNAWGLYDMQGNVLEWCADWYDGYALSLTRDPAGPDSGQSRMLRGGSYRVMLTELRAAMRFNGSPTYRAPSCGLRLAASTR